MKFTTSPTLQNELQATVQNLQRSDSDPRRVNVGTLRGLRHVLILVVLIVIALQLALIPDMANLTASALALMGNMLGYGYALRQDTLRRYPISSLMLLGYTFSYFTLPPLGQLLALHTIINHLQYPVADMSYAFIGLLALLGGHLLYVNVPLFGGMRGVLRKHFYGPLGFYQPPKWSQLWMMGAVGVLAVLLASSHSSGSHSALADALLQGLRPFVYVPYIALLPAAWSPLHPAPKSYRLGLLLYSVVLLALSVIVNSRSYLLLGFSSLLIVYLFLLAIGQVSLPKIRLRYVVLGIIATLLFVGPISELAMTMVLVRGERADLTQMQLLSKTWDTYLSGHITQRYERLMTAMSMGTNDEDYFDNLFLNRLGNMKFVDNAVNNQRALRPSAKHYFAHVEEQKILSILPTPAINFLGLSADKHLVTSGSSGDFLFYAASGNPYAIGVFRTGSLFVNLAVVFGYLWPLILLVLSAPVFMVVDSWTTIGTESDTGSWNVRFNPMVFGMMFSESFFFTSAATGTESISGIMEVLIRGWVQIGLLYGVVFWVSLMLTGGQKQ